MHLLRSIIGTLFGIGRDIVAFIGLRFSPHRRRSKRFGYSALLLSFGIALCFYGFFACIDRCLAELEKAPTGILWAIPMAFLVSFALLFAVRFVIDCVLQILTNLNPGGLILIVLSVAVIAVVLYYEDTEAHREVIRAFLDALKRLQESGFAGILPEKG